MSTVFAAAKNSSLAALRAVAVKKSGLSMGDPIKYAAAMQ
jgi:hypothetical protein